MTRMGRAYSDDLRVRILEADERGEGSCRVLAMRFGANPGNPGTDGMFPKQLVSKRKVSLPPVNRPGRITVNSEFANRLPISL